MAFHIRWPTQFNLITYGIVQAQAVGTWLRARHIWGRYTSTWPKQAQLIVAGRWKALATLQNKLEK